MRNELEKEQIVAASFAKKQGTGNSQVIDDILRRYIARDINWKDRLAEFLTEEIPLGDNWKRPEKRFHSQGYIIPTSEIDYRIRIAILNDLSGSVSDHLAKLWEDVINQNAAQWSDLEVLIINFDDQVVGDTIHLEKEDFPFHLKRASRGGTDYKPPFAALECEDFDPDVIFVLTDLICDSFPDISPIAPVIWCEACDSAWRRHQEMPPFGEIIRIRD
jgi:predicted metal-dependent peptidase